MNEEICKKCRRYGDKPVTLKMVGWLCAQKVVLKDSRVLPGFRVCEGYDWIQLGESMSPPDWCERPLEHLMTAPGEEVAIRQDDKIVEFNGNDLANSYCYQKTSRYIRAW